jgi:flagellar hook protein FlgE
MFSAISGLRTHQIMLDVTANDIANVNTIGYKSARTTFRDSLAQMQRGGTGADAGGTTNGGVNAAQVGMGVSLGSIDNMMQGGALQHTGQALDLAIDGAGFFRVMTDTANPDTTQYTRAGNFSVNSNGDLVTQDGLFVVDANGAKITIPTENTNVAVAADGTVSSVGPDGVRTPNGVLSVATFPNAAGLERVAGNRWVAGANSGAPNVGQPNQDNFGGLVAGAVEMSNVDLSTTFTNMITAQRGFQANSRVISTSDEMLQDLVNLKR